MTTLFRVFLAALMLASTAPVTLAQTQPPPEQVDEFKPIDQLPPQDQLPAAPLLVTAYSLVVLVLFAYVLSVARRLTAVRQDMERLEADIRHSEPGTQKRSGRT